MAELPRPLLRALRTLLEATTVDPNAAGMLYPVSPRSRRAIEAQGMFERGWDADRVWDTTGLTLSPDPDNTGRWLGPRSFADARWTDERMEPGDIGDLDAYLEGVPLPPSTRDRIQMRFHEGGGSYVDLSDDGHVVSLGNDGDRLGDAAHELQHVVGWDLSGVPRGTTPEAARASRIVQDAFADKMPQLKKVLAEVEETYWRDPSPANKKALQETRAAYDYALNNPDVIADHATKSVYNRELGEALARWAAKNARRSNAEIRAGKAPFSDLDLPLAKTLIRGESLWGKYRDRRYDKDVARLADFFKILTAMGGLGLSMGAVRQALESEMEAEGRI